MPHPRTHPPEYAVDRDERRRTLRVRLDEPLQDPDRAGHDGMRLAAELRDTIARERDTVRHLRQVIDRLR